MSTVAKLYLKNTSNRHIEQINRTLIKLGYPRQEYEGILYGPFPSAEHLDHYATWLTNDIEGLKQIKHFNRPITRELLLSFPWNEIGCFYVTLNGMSKRDMTECQILFSYAFNNPEHFNWDRSNCQQQLLQEYGFSFA